MNQFKRAQVIMLPTENKSSIWSNKGRRLYYNQNNPNDPNDEIRYNLYITTDDKIEDSDWCMIIDKKSILYGQFEQHKGSQNRNDQWGKIIATTDGSLNKETRCIYNANDVDIASLPQPSQQFIEQYIKSYNKGEVITDVLVEYEVEHFIDEQTGEVIEYITANSKIKINPKDNTITIKKLKDNWNREEVIYNVIKHRNDFLKFKTDSHYNPNDKEIKEWEDKWIKENL